MLVKSITWMSDVEIVITNFESRNANKCVL